MNREQMIRIVRAEIAAAEEEAKREEKRRVAEIVTKMTVEFVRENARKRQSESEIEIKTPSLGMRSPRWRGRR